MNRRDFLKSWSAACVAVGIVPGLVLTDKDDRVIFKPNKKTRAGLFGGVPVVNWSLTREFFDGSLMDLDFEYEPEHLRTYGYVDVMKTVHSG